MKKISTSLALKLRQDSIVERDYIIFSGEETKHYIWFNLYDDCYNNGNFIGTFVMKRLELTYNDSDLEFKQKEFNAYKEYKLDDGTWESIDYGTFIVQAVEESDTKEEIKVTAYDYTLKFANTYVSDLDYQSGEITLLQVLQECCDKCGIELATTEFANSSFKVDSNQFDGLSMYGNVIGAVAGISCNFAKIKADNKLYLEFKTETGIIIEASDYEEFEDKRDTLEYNAVSLGMANVEGENVTMVAKGVDPEKAKFLTINDNQFAYTIEKRNELITAIFNKINGFSYSSIVLKNCMFPQLECGDLIQVRNKDGQLVNSIVLRPTYEETQIKLEAPSTISSTVSYLNPPEAYDIAKLTQIEVDKAIGQIQSLTIRTEQIVDNINNNYYTVKQTNELIQTAESGITNTFSESGGNNILRNTGLWFENDGEDSETNPYEYWQGKATRKTNEKAVNSNSIVIQKGSFIQEQEVPDGIYSICFKYKKLIQLAKTKVKINDFEYDLSSLEDKEFYTGEKDNETGEYITQPLEVSSRHINIEFISDTNNAIEIYDLMCNKGNVKLAYSQNQNETTTDTVNISKGITITSSYMETIFKANANGIKILTLQGETIAYFTEKGLTTKEAIIEEKAEICGTLITDVGDQTWFTRM